MTARERFLAGDRPDDVALFFSDSYLSDTEALGEHAERVDGGIVLVVDGERGRRVFGDATGMDAMGFARQATREGAVDRDLTGGRCPEADGDSGHAPEFVLAFAEEQNEEAGGLYAEGDVVHAYAYCSCGTAYSDRWVADSDE